MAPGYQLFHIHVLISILSVPRMHRSGEAPLSLAPTWHSIMGRIEMLGIVPVLCAAS